MQQFDAQPASARSTSRRRRSHSLSASSTSSSLASSPRPSSAIPLDPRAEADALAEAYRQSRVQRLLAVRQASDAQAAQRREAYRAAQQREADQRAAERAAQAAAEAAESQRQVAAQLQAAQRQLGEAQRAAAEQSHQQQLAAEQTRVRRQAQEAQASQRFERALTLVQQRSVHDRTVRAERQALKETNKEAEKQVRVQIESAKKRQARRTPSHLIEYNRATPAATAAAPVPSHAALSAQENVSQLQMHISGHAHFSAHTPADFSSATMDGGFASDSEDAPAPLPTPQPHPHPSTARKSAHKQRGIHTPSVAVALNFASPTAAPAPAPAPAHLSGPRVAAGLDKPYSQRQRSRASTTAPQVQQAQERAFELVEKRGGQVVSQRIGSSSEDEAVADAAAVSEAEGEAVPLQQQQQQQRRRASSSSKTRRGSTSVSRSAVAPATRLKPRSLGSKPVSVPGSLSKAKAKAKGRASVPVLVPNAAFFAQQQQQQQSGSSSLFHPFVERSSSASSNGEKQPLAWVIPLHGGDRGSGGGAEESSASSESASAAVQLQPDVEVCVSGAAAVQSSLLQPAQRGLELLVAHTTRRAAALEQRVADAPSVHDGAEAPVLPAAKDAPVEADVAVGVQVGKRFYAQSGDAYAAAAAAFASSFSSAAGVAAAPATPAPSTPSMHAHAGAGAGDVFSSPLFPLASAAAARVASERAGSTPARSKLASDPASTPESATSLSSHALDTQLRSILQHHLHRDAAATQLLFSPHIPAPRSGSGSGVRARLRLHGSDGDSSDDEQEGEAQFSSPSTAVSAAAVPAATPASRSMWSTPRSSLQAHAQAPPQQAHTPLSWDSAGALFSGQDLSCPTSPLSPGALEMVSSPSAATDLFIEEINYALQRERAQAAEVEAQLREQRSPAAAALAAVAAEAPARGEGLSSQLQTPMQLRLSQQPEPAQHRATAHPSAATLSHPAVQVPMPVAAGTWSSPTAFLHLPPHSNAHVSEGKDADTVSMSGMVTPAKMHLASTPGSHLPVPQSADRAALLSAFRDLSAEDLMAVKPLRSASGNGASSLFHPTPVHLATRSHQFDASPYTPLRTPRDNSKQMHPTLQSYAPFTPSAAPEPLALRQPSFQHIAL